MSEDRFAKLLARLLGVEVVGETTDSAGVQPPPRAPTEARPEPGAQVAKHHSIRVFREQRELRIEFEWLNASWRRGFRIGALVVGSAVGVGMLLGWDVRAAVPIGLLLLYPNVASGFNRTVITIRDGWLRVVNRPLPWPLGGKVRLSDVEELRLRLTRKGNAGSWTDGRSEREGDLFARLRDGRERKLLTDQDAYRVGTERIQWVMQELRRELAGGRWTRT